MNALQEVILDRLIGAPGGDFAQPDGALGVAFQALLDASLVRGAPAQALGYPLMLSTALQGACAMFRGVEDQRQVAVGVFAAVTPSQDLTPLTSRRHVETALWCAQRVHPLICKADCPFLEDASQQIDQHFRNNGANPQLRSSSSASNACAASGEVVFDAIKDTMVTLRCIAYYTIDRVLAAARADRSSESPEHSSCVGAGYAGRLAGLRSGVPGAIDFCVALARELGL